MDEAWEVAIGVIEAKAGALEAEAARYRSAADALRKLAVPVSLDTAPSGVVTQGRTSDEVNAQLRRTFKCKVCKQVKAARPQGMLPKTCAECKEAAKKHP